MFVENLFEIDRMFVIIDLSVQYLMMSFYVVFKRLCHISVSKGCLSAIGWSYIYRFVLKEVDRVHENAGPVKNYGINTSRNSLVIGKRQSLHFEKSLVGLVQA